MNTWPSGANLTEVRGGGTHKHPQDPNTTLSDNLFTMDGPKVYKIARKKIYQIMIKALKTTKLTRENIDWIVPHQASGKAVSAYVSVGKFPKNKVCSIVSEFGNCVAASMPMALVMNIKNKNINRGQKILFIGTGAGLSAACAIINY